jgi:sugar/nucleoside kinase (ribokinase family)
MKKNRKGLLAAGNWIIDQIKMIDSYPKEESLVNILEESTSNGGSPYNILKNLSRMKVLFPLEAIGIVGEDERGSIIINDCLKHSIDVKQLHRTSLRPTSYTDVQTVQSTGKRTFFHNRGTNALLDESHFNLAISNSKIFHLGYLLLLDKLDQRTGNDLTAAARIFKSAQNLGLITSADLVSEQSNRFQEVVSPSLPFLDYLFINEYEAHKLTGKATLMDKGNINLDNCVEAALDLISLGINKAVIIHFPTGAIAVSSDKKITIQPSVNIPQIKIKSTVGAGDAFASGVLYGIHENLSVDESLKLGVSIAAACIHESTCSDGILPINDCLQLAKQYGYKTING